jgi:hypothetical protein
MPKYIIQYKKHEASDIEEVSSESTNDYYLRQLITDCKSASTNIIPVRFTIDCRSQNGNVDIWKYDDTQTKLENIVAFVNICTGDDRSSLEDDVMTVLKLCMPHPIMPFEDDESRKQCMSLQGQPNSYDIDPDTKCIHGLDDPINSNLVDILNTTLISLKYSFRRDGVKFKYEVRDHAEIHNSCFDELCEKIIEKNQIRAYSPTYIYLTVTDVWNTRDIYAIQSKLNSMKNIFCIEFDHDIAIKETLPELQRRIMKILIEKDTQPLQIRSIKYDSYVYLPNVLDAVIWKYDKDLSNEENCLALVNDWKDAELPLLEINPIAKSFISGDI